MNYYKRHIGDYLKDTSHLNLLEHGVYTRLLDVYYTREGPIPMDEAQRLIRAHSKEEKASLASVLKEFFSLEDGHYIQDRCNREIEAKEAKAETNRVNGKGGGRPKKETHEKPTKNPDGFCLEATQNPDGYTEEPTQNPDGDKTKPTKNLSHKPLATSHKPEVKEKTKTLGYADLLSGLDPHVLEDWRAIRKEKRLPITRSVLIGIEREASKSGMSLVQAITTCAENSWAGFNAAWLNNAAQHVNGKGKGKPSVYEQTMANAEVAERMIFGEKHND